MGSCIQMLAKKVDTLNKAMEVEAKKMRREVAAMEKEVAAIRLEKEQENKAKRLGNSKVPGNSSQTPSGRYIPFECVYKNSIFWLYCSKTCSSGIGNLVKALKLVYGMPSSSVLGNLEPININLLNFC
jgi:hypothetical protein